MAIRYLSGINVDSNTLFVDSTNNRVGIGTGSPTYQLHVTSSSAALGVYERTGGASLYLEGQSTRGVIGTVGNHDLLFAVNSLERFRVDTSGNVGIGTTSPTQKLDVNGYSRATSGFVGSTTLKLFGDNSSTEFVAVNTNGSVQMTSYGGGSITGTATYGLAVDSSGNIIEVTSTLDGSGTTNYVTKWQDSNTLTDSQIFDNGTNVGIGTASPRSKADINGVLTVGDANPPTIQLYRNVSIPNNSSAGNIVFGGRYDASNYATGASIASIGVGAWSSTNYGTTLTFATTAQNSTTLTERMRIASTGFVGINETTPLVPLHISRNSSSTGENLALLLDNNDTTVGSQIGILFRSFVGSTNTDFQISGKANSANNMDLLFLSDGTVERMRITSAGNVGIGTTAPGAKLEVFGTGNTLRLDSAANGSKEILFRNVGTGTATIKTDGDLKLYVEDAGKNILFDTTGGEKMRITAAGNVLIGTTTDSGEKMTVYGASEGAMIFQNSTSGTGAGSGLYIGTLNAENYLWTYENQPLIVATNNTERMRITAAGLVGIGTSAPGARFHVSAGYGLLNNAYSWAVYNTSSNGFAAQFGAADDVAFANTGNNAIISAAGSNSILFGTNSTERMRIASTGATRLNAYGSGSITGTATYGLAVDSSGNIIEVTSTLDGSGTTNYVTKWADSNTLTDSVIYDNGTNVGIGTASPTAQLHIRSGGSYVNSDANNRIIVERDAHAYMMFVSPNEFDQGLHFAKTTGIVGRIAYYHRAAGDSLNFSVNSGIRMTILSGGNVGIGTTAPGQKLHVVGKIYSIDGGTDGGQIIVQNSGGGNAWYWAARTDGLNLGQLTVSDGRIFVSNAGNVGIGTTNPTAKLFIEGNDITLNTEGSAQGKTLYFRYSNGANVQSDSYLYFSTGGSPTEKMRITDGGNVGIGTTAPGARLQIGSYMQMDSSANYPGVIGFNRNINTGAILNGSYGAYQLQNQSGEFQFQVYNSAGSQVTIHRLLNNGNVSFAGNVGIGTTSPQSRLDLSPPASQSTTSTLGYSANAQLNVRIPNSVGDVGQIVFTNDAAPTAGYASIGVVMTSGVGVGLGDIIMSTKSVGSDAVSTERMRITSGGNVGIGTTAPASKLHVFDGTNTVVTIQAADQPSVQLNTTDGLANAELFNSYGNVGLVGYATSTNYIMYHYGGGGTLANQYTSFQTAGAERMRITGAGNVGIGTTSPGQKLTVNGTAAAYSAIGASDNVRTGLAHYDTTAQAEGVGGQLVLGYKYIADTDYTEGAIIKMYKENSTSGHYGSGLKFQVRNNGDNLSTKVTINPSGNIGIGTTSPNKQLTFAHVNDDAIQIRRLTTGEGTTSLGTGISWTWTSSGSDNQTWAAIRVIMPGSGNSNMTFSTTPTGGAANLSERMRIADNGNVGIGTTSPDYKLDVSNAARAYGVRIGRDFSITNRATVRLDSNGDAPADILFGQTTAANQTDWTGVYWSISSRNSGAGAAEGNKFTIWRGSAHSAPNNSESQLITITPSLNVGIGTTSPANKLDVDSFGGGTVARFYNSDSNSASIQIGASDDAISTTYMQVSTGNGQIFRYNSAQTTFGGANSLNIYNSNGPIAFHASSSNLMTILTSGNVGIGTTSPSTTLEVAGTVTLKSSAEGGPHIYRDGGNAGDIRFYSTNGTFASPTAKVAEGLLGQIHFQGYTGSQYLTGAQIWGVVDGAVNSTTLPGRLEFKTGTGSPSIRMVIKSDGLVGIGTTAPNTKLHVQESGTNPPLAIQNTNANGYSGAWIYNSAGTLVGHFGWANGTTTALSDKMYFGTIAAKDVVFTTNDSEKVRITSAGNVGIGTAAPTKKLHVASSGNEGIFMEGTSNGGHWFDFKSANSNLWSMGAQPGIMGWFNRTDGTYKMVIADGGNVGIGTTAPAAKLVVQSSVSSSEPTMFVQSGTGAGQYSMISGGDPYHGLIMRGIPSAATTYAVTAQDSMSFFEYGSDFRFYKKTNVGPTLQLDAQIVSGEGRFRGDVVAYYSFSDERLKDDVKPLEGSLGKVLALQGVSYKWNSGERKGQSDIGLIAQQVEKVIPEIVREKTNIDGDTFKSVNYEHLVGVLIEAIKEQQQQIDELKAKLK